MSSSALSVSTVAGTTSDTAPSTMAGAFISTPTSASLAASISVKLSGENYLFWRAQVGPFLRSHLLMGYMDGSNPCPVEEITITTGETTTQQANPAFGRWVQTDQSILSAFVSSMTEGVVGMVLFTKIAREAWETLAGAFASTSIARSTGIRTQMADLKKNNMSINVYFHRMKALADTLASIGQPLRDEEFISYLLAGLDSDYDALYEVINTRMTPISVRDLFA
ncbi:uncharacterized protein [Lolium perenne]|uniref:uncharacterized protein n=1 Tax=Lolium perenne TaxID=4522 RepID=UPI003A9952CE